MSYPKRLERAQKEGGGNSCSDPVTFRRERVTLHTAGGHTSHRTWRIRPLLHIGRPTIDRSAREGRDAQRVVLPLFQRFSPRRSRAILNAHRIMCRPN